MAQQTSPNLFVRAARLHDLSRLSELLADSFHPRQGVMGLVHPILEFSIREDLRHRLRSPKARYACLVAVQRPDATAGSTLAGNLTGAPIGGGEPKIVGTLELAVRKQPPWRYGDPHTYISNLAVDCQYRRHGVARRLLSASERISLDWGVSTLNLHVMVDNLPARQLYHQAGYSAPPRKGGLSGLFQSSQRLLLHKHLI